MLLQVAPGTAMFDDDFQLYVIEADASAIASSAFIPKAVPVVVEPLLPVPVRLI